MMPLTRPTVRQPSDTAPTLSMRFAALGRQIIMCRSWLVVVSVVLAGSSAYPPGSSAQTVRRVEAKSLATPPADIQVREDGPYMLVRYTTGGVALQRYTGFDRITDITLYDDTTILVAEPERNVISAVTLDGEIVWTMPVRRPRCIQVLDRDRFLVCQDHPASIVEIDRAGTVYWEITEPLVDAAGAARLPDGNTAVVEGRNSHHAMHVISPDGTILWTGTEQLRHPRGLALLPTGELATSGFDTQHLVIFHPFSDKVRLIRFWGHPGQPSATKDGELLAATAEQQLVSAWDRTGAQTWVFSTLYPPYDVERLPDGTVLVSAHRVHAGRCLRHQLPRLSAWRWSPPCCVSRTFEVS